MFGLLSNLFQWAKKKSERRIAVVVLGLDNAGKTSVFNTLNGAGDQETTPSFGFTKATLKEGKYTVDLYDLGGGKNIRRIWNTYLPEVHGAIYVVDAADAARFPESKQVFDNILADRHLAGKPILVLANKQDLPTAAQPHEVATALGLDQAIQAQYNIRPTCAKQQPAAQPCDKNVGASFKWLVHAVDAAFGALAPRVSAEAEAHRQEELRKKREREERARAMREERLRREREAAEQQALLQQQETGQQAAVQLQGGVSIDSPLCAVPPALQPAPSGHTVVQEFGGLERGSKEMGERKVVAAAAAGADAEGQRRPLLSPLLPPCNNRVTPVVGSP